MQSSDVESTRAFKVFKVKVKVFKNIYFSMELRSSKFKTVFHLVLIANKEALDLSYFTPDPQ
jgi:hypothetical protein